MEEQEIKYYLSIDNNTYKITGWGTCPAYGNDSFVIETTEEIYISVSQDPLTYIYDVNTEQAIPNSNYEQEAAVRRRQELDLLTLTPSDVERALYRAKGMDFEDLKALIAQALPTVDMKALAIEFRANDFFRGATANGIRLFDVVGQLIGYTSEDMDYLFENKSLPVKEV